MGAAMDQETPVIHSFKGFDANFACRGFQYEVGKTYTHKGDVSPCNSGFHGCTSPLDVWTYYGPHDSRYARVDQFGDTKTHIEDSKVASSHIRVVEEVSAKDFVGLVIAQIFAESMGKGEAATNDNVGKFARIGSSGYSARIGSSGYSARIGSSGDFAHIGSSGDYAKIGSSGDSAKIGSSGYSARIGSSGYSARIGSSGDYAKIGSSGDFARIGSSGDYARIGSSGKFAQIGSSGDYAKIGSSGDSARIGSSGYYAKIGSSGYFARIGSSGDFAHIDASGKDSVIASAGANNTAKGTEGTWISLAEFVDGKCVGFATGCIGKDGLRPDVWYKASGGKLVAV